MREKGNRGIVELAGAQNTRIELEGNRRVELDGCKGILDYTTELIRIHVTGMIVKITGAQLLLRCMTTDALSIEGVICSIEFVSA